MTTYTTKPAAIAALNTLSLERLNELLRLNDMIFTPDSDQLINVTFSQMVDKAHALADRHFPEWTDRSKADFGEFLVELMALFSEKDFLYANAFGLESFIDRATKYSTVYLYAVTRCGYSPRMCKATRLAVATQYNAQTNRMYTVGEIILEDDAGNKYALAQTFNPINSSGGPYTVNLTFAKGVPFTYSAKYSGRGFRVPQKNVDFDALVCMIDGVEYTRVTSFSFSEASDKHYMAIPDNDGAVEIVFGRNSFGATPEIGSTITVIGIADSVVSTTPPSGNLVVTNDVQGSLTGVVNFVAVTNNGQSQESIVELRRAAVAHFRTQGNIINKYDLIDAVLENPNVVKATAFSYANSFVFYVVPKTGYNENTLIDELEAEIANFSIVEGFTVGGAVTDYVPVTVELIVYTVAGYPKEEIKSAVKTWLEAYTDPQQGAEYGKDFDLSEILVGLVSEIAGVQNVVFNAVNGSAAANVSISPVQILEKIDWDNIANEINVV